MTEDKGKNPVLGAKVSRELYDRIDEIAKARRTNRSQIVIEAIEQYLELAPRGNQDDVLARLEALEKKLPTLIREGVKRNHS